MQPGIMPFEASDQRPNFEEALADGLVFIARIESRDVGSPTCPRHRVSPSTKKPARSLETRTLLSASS